MQTVRLTPRMGNLDLFSWAESQYRPDLSLAARRLSRTHRLRPSMACTVAALAGFHVGEVRA